LKYEPAIVKTNIEEQNVNNNEDGITQCSSIMAEDLHNNQYTGYNAFIAILKHSPIIWWWWTYFFQMKFVRPHLEKMISANNSHTFTKLQISIKIAIGKIVSCAIA